MWNWFFQTQLTLTIKFVVGCCDLKSNRLDGGNKTALEIMIGKKSCSSKVLLNQEITSNKNYSNYPLRQNRRRKTNSNSKATVPLWQRVL